LRLRLSNKGTGSRESWAIGHFGQLLHNPEESARRTPQLLSKENIVIIRNRKRACLLCACSAVLIYVGLR
jgi:hypothetical protein